MNFLKSRIRRMPKILTSRRHAVSNGQVRFTWLSVTEGQGNSSITLWTTPHGLEIFIFLFSHAKSFFCHQNFSENDKTSEYDLIRIRNGRPISLCGQRTRKLISRYDKRLNSTKPYWKITRRLCFMFRWILFEKTYNSYFLSKQNLRSARA